MRHPLRALGVRRVVIATLVLVLVLGGGVVAWSATGASAAASYRSATAVRGSVEQTLSATGTVTPRNHADLSFGASGTVGSVAVELGDHVGIGETLAVLDRTALRDAVTSAEAAVAKARATLAADTTAQAAAVTAASTSAATSGGSGSSTSRSNGSSTGKSSSATSAATRKTLAQLAKQQAALTSAQRAADTAMQVSTAALAQQAAACAGVLAAADPAAPAPDVAGCQTALSAAQAAQAKVAAQQQKVEKAIATLTRSLSAALGAVSKSSSSSAGSTGSTGSSPNGSAGSTGSSPTPSPTASAPAGSAPNPASSEPAAPSSASATGQRSSATFSGATLVSFSSAASAASAGSAGTQSAATGGTSTASRGSSGTVTAATLARDQSAIDTARAALVRANASLDHARLTSPIVGTVAAVDVAPGDSVSSSTAAVVVNGDDGNVEITIAVTENDIRAIKVGQIAQVSADGAQATLPAKVTSVGLLAASDTGTASYPVVVSLAGAPMSLASGSNATVSVVTATATNAVTVPSSAVTRGATGSTGVVRVLHGSQVTAARVVVGAVGPVWTQITSGLKTGQRVVLADFSAALPSSSTNARIGGGFGGGGFGAGGFGGGGLGGAGFPGRQGTGNFTPRTTP
jgi:multidrug efflux pump subunit AcrA (membrane-fusion protein)